jgi:hypothetical protein
MRCPHCLTSFHDDLHEETIGEDVTSFWSFHKRICPSCRKFILSLRQRSGRFGHDNSLFRDDREFLCYPKGVSRSPLGPEVPSQFADDYREACLTLPDSSKASAALGRRCLQHVLREKAGVKHGNLANEIQQVIDSGKLPSNTRLSIKWCYQSGFHTTGIVPPDE